MRRIALVLSSCLLAASSLLANPLAELLDPARNFREAEQKIAGSDAQAARQNLSVALELSRADSPTWAGAMLLAVRDLPDLALAALANGEESEVPLTLMPEPIEASGGSPFTLPASYVRLDFLNAERRRLIGHLVKSGQEVEASRVLEQTLESEGHKMPLLLYLAALYERVGETNLAMQRYQEALQKITLEEDRFAILYSMLRILYRQEQFFEAGSLLKPYMALARAQVTQLVERVKSSPEGSRELLTQLLSARRHLVEGLNLAGILELRKGEHRNAQLMFEQAQLLNPGRLSIVLNYNQVLERGGHYETATGNLSRLRRVLGAVALEVQRLADQAAQSGLTGVPASYAQVGEALRRWQAVVTLRQGILLYDLRKLRESEKALVDATGLDSKEPLAFYYQGLIQSEENKLGEAQVSFRKALTFAGTRAELARLAKAKVDQILEAETATLLANRPREEKVRERAAKELDVKRLKPLQDGLTAGKALLAQKKLSEACALFARLAEEFPESPDPLHLGGVVRLESGDTAAAGPFFERALKIAPDFVPSLSSLAFVWTEIGFDAREAVTLAEKAHRLAGRDAGVLANLGWVYFYAGDGRRAIEKLKEAIAIEPKSSDHHLRLGLVFYRLGLHHFAVSKFQDLVSLEPGHPRGTVFLGLSLAKLGRARDALDQLGQALPKFPPPSELNRVLTSTIASLRKGLEARGEPLPPPPSAAASPAGGEAGAATKRILSPAMSPEEARRRTVAADALELAISLLKSGRRDEAKAGIEKAIEAHPGDPELLYALALLEIEDGRLAEARSRLDAILDVNPLDFRALHSLGDVYFRQGRMIEYKDVLDRTVAMAGGIVGPGFTEALAGRWQQWIETGPPEGTAYERLGLIRFHQYRFDEARRVLEQLPQSAEASLLLAEIRLHAYHRTKSEIEFQTARELLAKAAYAHMDALDKLWAAIRSPRLAEVDESVRKELAKRKKVVLSKEEFSEPVLQAVGRGEVDQIDLAETGVRSRRWEQITQKIEKTKLARTTWKERQQPVLEEIELDPGRRFHQPGGPGRKGGPLPKRAMGAAYSKDSTDPVTSTAETSPNDASQKSSAGASSPSVPAASSVVAVPAMTAIPGRRGLAERKLAMGVALVAQGRLMEAKSEFATSVALDQRMERSHTALALSEMALDEPNRARRTLEAAGRLFPAERIRAQAVSLLSLAAGDAAKALEVWSSPPPRRLEDFAMIGESRKIWNRIAADSPGDPDATYQLALLDYLDGEVDATLQRLEALKDKGGRNGTLLAAATLCRAVKRLDPAGFSRGVAILRVAPMPSLDRAVTALEEYQKRQGW